MSRRRFALPGFGASHFTAACLLGVATICGIGAATAEPLLFDVAQAEATYEQRAGEPIVSIRFTPDSARKFAEFTKQHVGHVTEMRLDGKVLYRPVIREPILQGIVQISGHFSVQEAQDLAARLASGTPLEIEAVAN